MQLWIYADDSTAQQICISVLYWVIFTVYIPNKMLRTWIILNLATSGKEKSSQSSRIPRRNKELYSCLLSQLLKYIISNEKKPSASKQEGIINLWMVADFMNLTVWQQYSAGWLLNTPCYKLQNGRPDPCSHLSTNAKGRGQATLRAISIFQWAANAIGILLFPPLCSYFFSFSSSSCK